jgi:hypothetical protein
VAILNKQKCHFFSFTKSENRRAKTGPVWGVGTRGRGEGKRCRMVTIVQILHIHVHKWKNDTVETIPGLRRDKEE